MSYGDTDVFQSLKLLPVQTIRTKHLIEFLCCSH